MYRALGLLRSDTDFTIEEAHTRLTAKFPGFNVARNGAQIVISKGQWWIAVALVSGSHLQVETEVLTGHLAGVEPSEAAEYVASNNRVEVWTDEPDPFIEHFNDYLSVVEVLKSFSGLLAVDPKEPGIL